MRASVISSFVFCLLLAASIPVSHALDISVVGADPGPNATGEIPPWEGHKYLPCPSDYTPGQYFDDPYKDEKPLFRIDHTNVDEYKDRLSPAQIMRLRKHKNFYMNVYRTRRNIQFCPEFYAATEKNKETCHVDEKGVLHGFQRGDSLSYPKERG